MQSQRLFAQSAAAATRPRMTTDGDTIVLIAVTLGGNHDRPLH